MTIYLAVNASMPLKAEDIAVLPPGAVAALYAQLALELPHEPGFAPDVLRSLRGDYHVTAPTPSAAGDRFIASTQERVRDVPAGAELSLDPCGGTVCVPTAHGHLCRPTLTDAGGQEWRVEATYDGTVYRARPYILFDVVETQPL